MSFIYALTDPYTLEVRYIGKTNDPNKRYSQHFAPHELGVDSYKSRWIASLLRKNTYPTMIMIEECSQENLNSREIFWISNYRNLYGWRLTNSTNGGDGGNLLIREDIKRRHSENTSKGLKGKKKSPEHIQNMTLPKIGKKHTEEHKRKIGLSVSGNKNGFYGKHHSDELKSFLRERFTGKPMNFTEEQKEKMRKTRFVKKGKYLGVSKVRNRYRARTFINGKEIHFGCFATPEEAALAFNREIIKYFPNAPLNCIDDNEV